MRKLTLILMVAGLCIGLAAGPVPKAQVELVPFSLALASPQNVDNYMERNGSRWVVRGSLDIASGGDLDIESGASFKLAGTAVTTSAAELNYLDGLTAGTVTASKFVLVDANKDISTFRNLSAVTLAATNLDAGASGTAGTVDVFPSSATSGKIAITAADNAADHTITIVNASHGQATTYTLPDIGQATGNIVTLKASQTTAGELKRADLTEDALAVYGINLYDLRAADLAELGISETAGDHFLYLNAGVVLLKGESSQNETEASVSYFTFTLPPEYVAAGDVKVRVNSKVDGSGTLGTCTVDIEAYEQADGAVGSDICATAAQDIDATYANDDFTITATGLVAGDKLTIKLTTSVEETGNSNPLEAHIDEVALLLDVKG